ncbi:MAG: hypothetical protein PWQ55_8 [Chloroflexota bacterium]|nr:hypothetical protein [Chloroflexota bacterium]
MYFVKQRKRRYFGLALCCIIAAAALFITSPVFADGEVPAESGASETQPENAAENEPAEPIEEVGTADAPTDQEIGEPAADEPEEEAGPAQDEDGAVPSDSAPDGSTEDEDQPAEAGDPAEDLPAPDQGNDEEIPGDEAPDQGTQEDEDDGVPSILEEPSGIEGTQEEPPVDLVVETEGSQDLAGREAVESASSGDPYWLVGSQYYSVAESEGGCYPGTSVAAGTCWVSTSPIATALEKIEEGLLPNDRKLYVKAGEYNGDLDISGVFLSQMNGLIGLDGSSDTIINGNVSVAFNNGGFTLSGFIINGSVSLTDTAGNVVLEDLQVSNPSGDGVRVYNTEWYEYNPGTGNYDIQVDGPKFSGTITVENVNSSGNLGMGGQFWGMDNITISNSTFSSNGGTDGVDDPVDALLVDTSWGSKNLSLYGVSASDNNGTGIRILANKNVTLDGIVANNNSAPSYVPGPEDQLYGFGLFLNGASGKLLLSNIFTNNNGLTGTSISAMNATVLVSNLNASQNGEQGLALDTQGAFTLNTAVTNGNGANGIIAIVSKTVLLSSLTSCDNGANGLQIMPYAIYEYDAETDDWVLTGYSGPTSVTLNSPKNGGANMANTFANNGDFGVFIESKGTVTLSNLDAYGNNKDGVFVDNRLYDEDSDTYYGKGNVTLNVTIPGWNNGFTNNGEKGVEIYSLGLVKVSNTFANNNNGAGVYIDAQNTIQMASVTAENNGGNGAFLTNLDAAKARPVSVSDSFFNGNGDAGIVVLTAGAITFSGSSASSNMSPNQGGPLDFPVTIHDVIYGSDSSESWGFYGYIDDMLIISMFADDFDGTVTLYDSLNNVIDEADSIDGTRAMFSVTLTVEDWYRIEVSHSGMSSDYGHYTLSVNDAEEQHNYYPGAGAVLDNSAGKAKVTISTTKYNNNNIFDNNQNVGLRILSNSSIMINNISASHNYSDGLDAENPNSTGSVTIQDKSTDPNSYFEGNTWDGVHIYTLGAINLYGLSASNNGGSGFFLQNTFFDPSLDVWLGKAGITINNRAGRMSMVEQNGGFGIWAGSNGNINVTNVIVNNNGGDGAALFNHMAGGSGAVNVKTAGSVVNEFSSNGWNTDFNDAIGYHGLVIYSNGNIMVKNSMANDNSNQGSGMYLNNAGSDRPRKVMVNDSQTSSNNGYGTFIETTGPVALMRLEANSNGWNGIDVDACQEEEGVCAGNGTLKISDVRADENGGVGIQAHAFGLINVAKAEANRNGDKGIRLNNQFSGANASIILANLTTNENNDTGIMVNTNGSVTMRELQAENNNKTWGYMNVGDAVSEYYNFNQGADHWGFDANAGEELTIWLFPSDNPGLNVNGFAGTIALYDSEGNSITGFSVVNDGDGTGIVWTPSETGFYYVGITENNESDGFYRLSINNPTFTDTQYFFVDGMSIDAGQNVTMTGSNYSNFNNNSLTGLYVITPGNINLRSIQANSNGTEGASLNNFMDIGSGNPAGYGKINVAGRNDAERSMFNGNGWQGLNIRSANAVSLLYLNAYANGMEGIRMGDVESEDENAEYIGGKVTGKNLYLYGNGGDGMSINAKETISLNSIFANSNGGDGAHLRTKYGEGDILINGNNYFWGNGGNGLYGWSHSNARVSGIDARSNGNYGIFMIAEFGQLSLDKATVQDSGNTGILVAGLESVKVSKVTSFANGIDSDGDGIFIYAAENTITSLNSSTFMGNGGNGIEVNYFAGAGLAPTISKTYYFGNDVDYDGTEAEANIFIHS